MRVDFPGPVTIKDDAADDLLPPSAVAIQISAMKNGGAYSLMCICTETANSALLTPDFVKKTRGKDLADGNWSITASKFTDSGPIKTLEDRATSTNYAGTFVRKMIAHVEGRCINAAEAASRSEDERALDGFLATFRDSRGITKRPETKTVQSPQASTAETRLHELQRLRDQGLITQQEFDEKRRAIVGSL
ncbi:MAG: SHOCT domain-containing protein [Alphaproteobacteria bacterium]